MQIAVFGANGMLGSYVSSYLKKEGYDVVSLTRKEFDIEKDDVDDLPDFDMVINCAGVIKQKSGDFYRINSEFPKLLSKRYRLIQISTDCVFNGAKGSYTYKDHPNSTDDYGDSKIQGEVGMVIRTSIIGEGSNVSLLDWVLSQKKVNGYINHFWNGLTCLEVAKQLRYFIHSYEPRIHHLHGLTYSKYELCKIISDVYKVKIDIKPTTVEYCNRTLSGIFCNKPIDKLLEEQKQFKK